MKKIFLILCLFSIYAFSSELIHPLDFKGTEKEKLKVVAFIANYVKVSATALGMDNPEMLKLMESSELKSFQDLTHSSDRKTLDKAINESCSIGICIYSMISMMYNQELVNSNKKLSW